MKKNCKLYEKKFDLKKSNIYGGRVETQKETVTSTSLGSCSDTEYYTTDDNGTWIGTCTDTEC